MRRGKGRQVYVQYSTDTGAVRSSGGGPPPTTPVETGGFPMGSWTCAINRACSRRAL